MKTNDSILSQDQMTRNEMIRKNYGKATCENPIMLHGEVTRTLLGNEGEKLFVDICDEFGIHHIMEDTAEEVMVGEKKTYVVTGLETRPNGVVGCICEEYTGTNFFDIYGPQSPKVAYQPTAVTERDGQMPKYVHWLTVVQQIAGMANTDGGTIYVGVCRDGSICGIDYDFPYLKEVKFGIYSADRIGWNRYLQDLISNTLSPAITKCLKIDYHTFLEGTVCAIHITPSKTPIWADKQIFTIREGIKRKNLKGDDILLYCCKHYTDYMQSIMTAANELHLVG